MNSFLPFAYFQEQFVPFAEAKISIATHALQYGTATIGGLRGIPDPDHPQQVLLFRLDRHCRRLSDSARFLDFDLPAAKIEKTIVEFVQKNRSENSFYIRPFIYTSGLGIAPRIHDIEKDFFIYGLELGDYLSPEGVSCRFSSWHRQEDRSLPLRGKMSSSYIASALAKTEAVTCGFDEAIMMNSQGKVSEASGMNIFVVRNGQLITPGFDQDILEGITRDSILKIAQDLGIQTLERPIDKSELLIADEVFLSGTAAKIAPVKQIENYELSASRPITKMLREKLVAIMANQDSNYSNWVYKVSVA